MQPTTQPIALAACKRWHYTRTLSAAISLACACFERPRKSEPFRYIGVVVFGSGACPWIGKSFKLSPISCRELVRVALDSHSQPVTAFIAASIRLLRLLRPRVRLVVSYADSGQGHHGGIYQAGNWVSLGPKICHAYRIRARGEKRSRLWHGRSVASKGMRQSVPWLRRHVDPQAARITLPARHKYALGFSPAVQRRLVALRVPPPSRFSTSRDPRPRRSSRAVTPRRKC